MTATVPLYELARARDILDEWFVEHEGEVTPELAQMLEEIEGQVNEKIERVGLYIQEQYANATSLENHPIVLESKRLLARAAAFKKRGDGLKEHYLKPLMERLGKDKVEGLTLTVALQKNSVPTISCAVPSAVFDENQGDLFVERVETVEYRLRRDAIIGAWKDKKPLPAGVFVELGRHVRLR